MVLQIVGAKDDFVSPQDQIDLDVEGVRAWFAGDKDRVALQRKHGGQASRNYYVLEMPDANHRGVLNFRDEYGGAKRNIFVAALTKTAAELQGLYDSAESSPGRGFVRDPANFWDTPPIVDTDVTDLVFVIHGIRDDGYWTHRVAAAVKRAWEAKRKRNPGSTKATVLPLVDAYLRLFPNGRVRHSLGAEETRSNGLWTTT